jgi:predicted neuraminidase
MKLNGIETLPKEKERKISRHASTLLQIGDGRILAAYFAGAFEAEPDVDIYLTIRGMAGRWSDPRRVSAEEGLAHWNPVLALRSNGDILLFYKVGFEIAAWKTMLRISKDGGSSWGEPRELVPGDSGGRGPVRNKLLVLDEGTWLAGASLEQGPRWTAFVDRSTDEGRTWRRSADIRLARLPDRPPLISPVSIAVSEQSFRGRGIIQPSLWQSGPALAHLLLRSSEGFAYRSDSSDGGRTWCDPYRTGIPNNNSALDIVRLDGGGLALAHNPIGGSWSARTPLVVSESKDDGETWERGLVLDEGPGEFSYPALVRGADSLLVSWTRNRSDIAFARIELP